MRSIESSEETFSVALPKKVIMMAEAGDLEGVRSYFHPGIEDDKGLRDEVMRDYVSTKEDKD